MKDGLIVLKDIGAQKIHEKTHISRGHVQAILHESFEGLTKLQVMGFISIFEREYSVELNETKANAIAYYDELTLKNTPNNQVFVVAKKKKSFTGLYIMIVLLIFVAVAFYTISSSSSSAKIQDNKLQEIGNSNRLDIKEEAIDNSTRLNIKEEVLIIDENKTTSESNSSNISEEKIAIVEIESEIEEVPKSLKILPKSKVWVGYIELKTHKKHQAVVREYLNIDTKKDWLLVFGHGNINIEVNGEVRVFKSANNLRFLYKEGNLTKIDSSEFKQLNRGRKW